METREASEEAGVQRVTVLAGSKVPAARLCMAWYPWTSVLVAQGRTTSL